MRDLRFFLAIAVSLTMVLVTGAMAAGSNSLPAQSTALERGYRTGYSDGYNAGFKDVTDSANRDFRSKQEYQQADRSYNEVWGPIDDYRDGYQQGFERGYATGYDRQAFDSSIPKGLGRRGGVDTTASAAPQPTASAQVSVNTPEPEPVTNRSLNIPRDTILTVELLSPLSTETSQRGDPFHARVVQPNEYAGATVDGRVAIVKRPGRTKGVAELQLSFEQIRLPDNRATSFRAEVIEVVQMSGNDGVGRVDPEGGVKGRDSTKDDVTKVGAATGIGAIIGAIAGGGKGAAIGAAIGGSVGTAGVLSTRGQHIRLPQGQQLRIRTATDSQL